MTKPTMNDVAKLAGVSQSTVSFVLNNAAVSISEETKRRVKAAVKQLDFKPRKKTKNYAKKEGSCIALIIPNASNHYYMEMMRSVSHFSDNMGYRLITINTNRTESNEEQYLQMLSGMQPKISGIIYGFTPTQSSRRTLASLDIPTIVIGELLDEKDLECVSLDSYISGMTIANHLIDLGHTRLAYITSPPSLISLSRARRLAGIREACRGKAVLEVFTKTEESEFDSENYEQQLGYELTLSCLAKPHQKVSAYIGANDMISLGILQALEEKGKHIPDDVSVCGFDNLLLSSYTHPPLTTMDHHSYGRCGLAVELLNNKILNKYPNPSSINYLPTLIVRESTGRVPPRSEQ